MAKKRQLSTQEYARAMVRVATLSIRIAPQAVLFKLVGIGINASLPIALTYFSAQTINQLTAAYNNTPGAGKLAITYAVVSAILGLISTVWSSLNGYAQQIMRFKIEARVSDIMYDKFLSLEFWRYDDKATIDLYDRAQKFSQFYAYIFDRLSQLVTEVVSLLFALVALFAFLPVLSVAVLLAVLPGMLIQFKISRAQLKHWNNNVEARRTISYIEWNLFQPVPIAELRLNGLVKYFMSLRQKLRQQDEGERLKYEQRFIPRQLLSTALETLIELGALLWIVVQIIHRQQPLGQFVYVQQLVSRAISGANGFIGELSTIDEDLGNLYDYQKFMELPSQNEGGTVVAQPQHTIIFDRVSFSYPNQKAAVLTDISLTIKPGNHIALVGENGAGKSTLIKLLAGMYTPTSGSITVDGINLNDIGITSWQKQLSILQQDFQHYFFANAKDNIYFGDVSKELNTSLLHKSMVDAEAKEFIDKLPHKENSYLDTWVEDNEGNPGTNLSGGQWQRLALARSFYRNAPIVIMDEPTSAIDALAEGRIFDRLFAASNHKTVITVSHRLSTIEKADSIVVLENGKIIEQGTHQELVDKHGAYTRLFKRQLRQ